jgi:hypothetical protein
MSHNLSAESYRTSRIAKPDHLTVKHEPKPCESRFKTMVEVGSKPARLKVLQDNCKAAHKSGRHFPITAARTLPKPWDYPRLREYGRGGRNSRVRLLEKGKARAYLGKFWNSCRAAGRIQTPIILRTI